MNDMAFLQNAAAQLQAASAELAQDNDRAEVRRWQDIKDFIDGMTDEELRIVFGGHYDNQTRYWLGFRMVGQINMAESAAQGNPVHPEDHTCYLDAVDKDETRFNDMMGRTGVRFAGD